MTVRVKVSGANRRAAEIDSAVVVATESVLTARTTAIMDNAYSEWPRESGESAQGLREDTKTSTNGVRAAISGSADHTEYVQVQGVNQWDLLVRKPMKDQAGDVAREVATAIAKRAD
jgi:hypothetical protein